MKKYVSCAFWILLTTSSVAQDLILNFQQFIEAGKTAKDELRFDDAIKQFEAAKILAESNEGKEMVDSLLDDTKNAYISAILEEQQKTEKERIKAVANQLALLATKELESDSAANALILAFAASKLLGQQLSPAVKFAFGQAVFAHYATVHPLAGASEIYSISALKEYPGFLCQTDDNQIVLVNYSNGLTQQVGQHPGHITSSRYIPTVEKMLTTSTNGSTIIWSLEKGKEKEMTGHDDDVTFAMLSVQDGLVLSGSRDQTARLWDNQGKSIATLKGHTGYLYEGHFSGNGVILTRASDGLVKLWDRAGNCLQTIDGHEAYVYSAAFWPGGRQIITTSADGTAKVWDLQGKLLFEMNHGSSPVRSAVVSSDEKRILTRSIDQKVRLWDEKGVLIRVINREATDLLTSGLSADGNFIFYSESGGRTFLWDQVKDHTLTVDHPGGLQYATASIDRQNFLTTSAEGIAKLWDDQGNLLFNIDLQTQSPVPPVFSANGEFLAAALGDGLFLRCPLPNTVYRQLLDNHNFPPEKIKELERKYDLNLAL